MSLLAVAQFAPGDDTAANLAEIERLTGLAAHRGASLVVFPEYSSFFEPDLGPASVAAAQGIDGEFVATLGALARRHGIHLVAGMLETGDARRVRNTLVALGPDGALLASYRKVHLYDAFGVTESDRVLAGDLDEPQTFHWDGFTVGLQTCYDVRFPEASRRLVDAGADLLLVPAEWVRGPLKEHHWRTLLTARAIENTVYVAAADHAPPIGIGSSLIVDPMGVPLAGIGDETGVVAVAELSPDRLAAVPEHNPALRLRRFGVVPRDRAVSPETGVQTTGDTP